MDTSGTSHRRGDYRVKHLRTSYKSATDGGSLSWRLDKSLSMTVTDLGTNKKDENNYISNQTFPAYPKLVWLWLGMVNSVRVIDSVQELIS